MSALLGVLRHAPGKPVEVTNLVFVPYINLSQPLQFAGSDEESHGKRHGTHAFCEVHGPPTIAGSQHSFGVVVACLAQGRFRLQVFRRSDQHRHLFYRRRFIMFYSSHNDFGQPGAVSAYYFRRFARLISLYWICVIVYVLANTLATGQLPRRSSAIPTTATANLIAWRTRIASNQLVRPS